MTRVVGDAQETLLYLGNRDEIFTAFNMGVNGGLCQPGDIVTLSAASNSREDVLLNDTPGAKGYPVGHAEMRVSFFGGS